MKKRITSAAAIIAFGAATPAFAHGSAHTDGFFAHLAHWMSSPVHGLLSIAGIIAVGSVAVFLFRKKA
ncbi:hypothetical protein ACJ3XI_04425 [Litorimonas sp. RW-G-Af-16]|uniref:hypothetical protein n=1 Tax=Litorimonas sp. RW-G-Af-16 TaxID=3241168 RepID=UPI00390C4BF6